MAPVGEAKVIGSTVNGEHIQRSRARIAALDVAQGGLLRNGLTYVGSALAPSSGALGVASSIAAVGTGSCRGRPRPRPCLL
jgi:hypothetical protein